MQKIVASVGCKRLDFDRGLFMDPSKVRRPLAERILIKWPRLASVLSACGAKHVPRDGVRAAGELAAMMTASGSIDPSARQGKQFRFYIRPMC